MAEEAPYENQRRWRDNRDQMTGNELRADALANGFVLDDAVADDPIV